LKVDIKGQHQKSISTVGVKHQYQSILTQQQAGAPRTAGRDVNMSTVLRRLLAGSAPLLRRGAVGAIF
jgi:hypothetical protein